MTKIVITGNEEPKVRIGLDVPPDTRRKFRIALAKADTTAQDLLRKFVDQFIKENR